MTRAELRAEVRRQLDDASERFVTNDDINDSLNEGYEDMSDVTEWYERTFNLRCQSGRNYYNIRDMVQEELIRVLRCYSKTGNWWLHPDSLRNLDGVLSQWETNRGEPRSYLMRGHWWMGLWPKPSADFDSVERVYYSAMPPALTLDTDAPGFPDEFHRGLVDYALYDIYMQDRDPDVALNYYARYLVFRNALDAYVDGRQSLDHMPGRDT